MATQMKKLSDKDKVARGKATTMRCLEEIKNNKNSAQVLSFLTGQLAYLFALLDSDKTNEMGIVFVASDILTEVDGRKRKTYVQAPPNGDQLELPGVGK